jgi:hypothetical protein
MLPVALEPSAALSMPPKCSLSDLYITCLIWLAYLFLHLLHLLHV